MTTLVITVLGTDRPGLVASMTEAVARHEGNWDRSQLARVAGKFAGIVLVEVPELSAEALVSDLSAISDSGVLDLTIERVESMDAPLVGGYRASLTLVGQDHPGLLHEVAVVFASLGISIEELETDTAPAPMGGFVLFGADASVFIPDEVTPSELESALEAIANDLMVDIEFE